ncbi:hypothetical protein DH09_08410 [Bacillaceae bacterium JMAK1]|nr:hypothetical protein DH09_08410 [Bacillaceae bacterium JMAK1]
MKKIQIVKLSLKNFKGIKSFVLQAEGADLKVFGDNATGKTTIYDAFLWLLFGKDSTNSSKFAIKTLDHKGEVLHGLEHEVEVVLLIDGAVKTLKKVYSEEWTKKRGRADKEFTGHTVDHYVDTVPAKKKEFDAEIGNIISEDVFKLITSPSYFNEELKWKERRETLLTLAGADIDDSEVISSDKKLERLLSILDERPVDKHREIVKKKQKDINEELQKIPVRISEVSRGLPDLNGLDQEELHAESQALEAEIGSKQDEVTRLNSGTEVTEQKRLLSEIETEINEIKAEYQTHNQKLVSDLSERIHSKKLEANNIQSTIRSHQQEITSAEQSIARYTEQANGLRDDWKAINDRSFTWNDHSHDEGTVCPTCAQSLPEDQIAAAREKAQQAKQTAQDAFNQRKASQLEEVVAEGKRLKSQIESFEQVIEGKKATIESDEVEYQKALESVQSLEAEYKTAQEKTMDISESFDYQEKVAEKNRIISKIDELKQSAQNAVSAVQIEITELKEKLSTVKNDLYKFEQSNTGKSRISELTVQERDLADRYEELEEQLFLTEHFTRTKTQIIEDRINGKFEFATFKLFETLVNGGVEETCETLYKGVPYSKGLNNAARINVGLDIIRTLSEHYGISVPIFIDNSEAVTELFDINAQTIALTVSGQDKQLRVEYASEQHKEAI